MCLWIQSFSQSAFSKRKYRKGIFIEKVTHLKHKKATEMALPGDTLSGCKAIREEKVSATIYIPVKHDTLAVADSDEDVVALPRTKHAAKGHEGIIKHNTLKLAGQDAYCLGLKPLNEKIHRQTLQQELTTSSVVMKKMPDDETMMGAFMNGLFEGFKSFFLFCVLIIMVSALMVAVLAVATYPVASLSWGVALGVSIYALLGIVVSVAILTDRDYGRFMGVLKIIFWSISAFLVFFGGAVV